jgi:poly(3-hydroxybutyrate) depolymerase
LSYALHRPENTKEKKTLIIFFLHGSGEKGTDRESKSTWSFK